jgi:replicative DNA helicase
MTTGFQNSELVIVAARPSMGKTAFCLNLATHAAIEGHGVAVFSLEMSKDSLVQRMLCAEARVDSQAVRRGMLRDTDFTRLARAAGTLQTCPIWIDDTPALTLLEMRSKARRLKADNDLKLVIVDYLQLMRSPEYADNRVQEISDISRSLKQLARELELPVIALSQLSRASEQRGGDRMPLLSDLRDSGAIEQDADIVLFIHRPEMYRDLREKAEQGGESLDGKAEVIMAKHRNGPTGSIDLYFHKQFTRFASMSAPRSRSSQRSGGGGALRPGAVYRCTECGHDHPKWTGRCEACGAWNSVGEEPTLAAPHRADAGRRGIRIGGRARSRGPAARHRPSHGW